MYEMPVTQKTVKLVMYEDDQNPLKSIQTGSNGEFELRQVLQEKDFIQFNTQTISVGLSITFDFTNKILEQESKVKSYINGSVIDNKTLNSIVGAKVQAIYFFPMMIAKKEVITNKVGYFEFNLELDYFEVIIVDLIITKDGYKDYQASLDPEFAKDKGIALYDKYTFTFYNSIKLESL